METRGLDTRTVLYGVFGDPVSQSLSPLMHNLAFSLTQANGVYCAFRVSDIGRAMDAVRVLGMGGASITIPHKVRVMDYLDSVDDTAKKMGAVNTVINQDGRLHGTNTDGPGAVRALLEKTALSGKKAVIAGSGGAARAIAFALQQQGAKVIISNRKEDRAEAETLAAELGAPFVLTKDIGPVFCDILINATPVGMAPLTDAVSVPLECLRKGMVVMDIVYHPLMTRLLREAKVRGCTIQDGLAMFVYQGAAQFELWTGRPAPASQMRGAVLAALETP